MSNNLNEKNFTLVLNNIRNFTIKIINFATSASLSLLIRLSLSLSATPHMRTRMLLSLGISKIDFSFIPKVTIKMLSSLGISKINMITIMKVLTHPTSTINMFLPLVFNLKRNLRAIGAIDGGKINFSFSPVVATFIKLEYFDPLTLTGMDSATLLDLDQG